MNVWFDAAEWICRWLNDREGAILYSICSLRHSFEDKQDEWGREWKCGRWQIGCKLSYLISIQREGGYYYSHWVVVIGSALLLMMRGHQPRVKGLSMELISKGSWWLFGLCWDFQFDLFCDFLLLSFLPLLLFTLGPIRGRIWDEKINVNSTTPLDPIPTKRKRRATTLLMTKCVREWRAY